MNAEDLEGLNLPQLIDRLADVAVPAPVSYAPETVGWWVLAGLLVIGLALATIVVNRRRQRSQYRRAALDELNDIEARATDDGVLHDAAAVVRRTALIAFPRQDVAHLYGDAWREFLTRSASIDLGPGVDALVNGPYRRPTSASVDEPLIAARRWIEWHHA